MIRTDSERLKGRQQHVRMRQVIAKEFPQLTDGQRWYIQNKVSRILRNLGDDIIEVWVTSKPINPAQYCTNRTFTVGEDTKVYVTIQVD